MNTVLYIDGFNLPYGRLRHTPGNGLTPSLWPGNCLASVVISRWEGDFAVANATAFATGRGARDWTESAWGILRLAAT
jgi:hypothetical protein